VSLRYKIYCLCARPAASSRSTSAGRAGEAEYFGVLHKALADAIRQSVMEDGGERSPSSLFELRRDLAEALAKAGNPEINNQ